MNDCPRDRPRRVAALLFFLTLTFFGVFTRQSYGLVKFEIDSGASLSAPAVFSRQSAAQEVFLPELYIDGSTSPSELLITEIAPVMHRLPEGDQNPLVRLMISRAIGLGTVASDLVATYSIEVGNFVAEPKVIETNLRLDPGRYFVIASSNAENWAAWHRGDRERVIGRLYLSSQFDPEFPADGIWHDHSGIGQVDEGWWDISLGIKIEGHAIPEPSTAIIFLGGLGCVVVGHFCFRGQRAIAG